MIYYGNYDNDGLYIGFYNKDIHGSNIPDKCIKLNYSEWQEAISGNYKVINGKHIKYDKSLEELNLIELADLRFKRDFLLNQSDWTQLSDTPMSERKRHEWKIYRQELRDITNSKPYVFPTKPEM